MGDAYRAVERIYHDYLTGLILTTVTRRDPASAAELVFRTFRRQHLEKFLPGLEKLGLTGLPHAVACARYHYLSNQLGGVRVEYMEESPRKAWVRYVPPRWIYPGATIYAVPSDVTRAMLPWLARAQRRHARQRAARLCLHQDDNGRPARPRRLLPRARPRARNERLRFAPDEEAPDFDPARAPRVPSATWPPERLRKVVRNYTMDYVRSILPELVAAFGSDEARRLGGITGLLIGMQDRAPTAEELGIAGDSAQDFAEYLRRLGEAQGDHIEWHGDGPEVVIRQTTWRLMDDVSPVPDGVFESWNALWEGALSVHNRRLALAVTRRLDHGDDAFEWRVRPRRDPRGPRTP